MKIFKELSLILLIYLIGEVLSNTLNLPIPGNILGMVLLLLCLCLKIIKLEWIETVSDFFMKNLAFFFIPASVGIIASFSVLKSTWHKIFFICFFTTIITLVVTGLVTQSVKKIIDRRN